jgi:hypothetical protein
MRYQIWMTDRAVYTALRTRARAESVSVGALIARLCAGALGVSAATPTKAVRARKVAPVAVVAVEPMCPRRCCHPVRVHSKSGCIAGCSCAWRPTVKG